MTIKKCDYCHKEVKELEQVREEYGSIELCKNCMKEIDDKLLHLQKDQFERSRVERISLFNEWMFKIKES